MLNNYLKIFVLCVIVIVPTSLLIKSLDYSNNIELINEDIDVDNEDKIKEINYTHLSELNQKEQSIINKVIELRNSQPTKLRKEMQDYMEKVEKLRKEKRELYINLSQEAKKAMRKEKDLKRYISLKAKKVLNSIIDQGK